MNKQERLALANWAMTYALNNGANQVAISITKQRQVELGHRESKLEKIQESTTNSLYIRLFVKGRYSTHSTSDLKKASLEKFISNAISMTGYLAEDKYRELPDPKYYEGRKQLDLEINDPSYQKLKPEQRVQFAKEIEAAAVAVSDKIISATAGFTDTYREFVNINSLGFVGDGESTNFSAYAEATVAGEEGKRPEDYYSSSARIFSKLAKPEFIGKQASERALRKIGQKKISSNKMPMLVENRIVSNLISALMEPLSGLSLYQKRSFLDGKLNQKIFADIFTMTDDPFIKQGLGSRLFDGEGISAKVLPIIEKGVLKNYYINYYYGKKLGVEPTTGGSSNIVFEYGSHSLDELIKNLQKGIFITSFIGGNSNSTTGDFSYGLQGYYIENGNIIQAVNEMNISGNMNDLWNQLVELGNDPYPYSSYRCPSMLFDGVQFSGL